MVKKDDAPVLVNIANLMGFFQISISSDFKRVSVHYRVRDWGCMLKSWGWELNPHIAALQAAA
jgi:hypothetical protein